jgi:hypothetical protein
MGSDYKLVVVTLFATKTIKEKNAMVATLLSMPIFVSSRNFKKMGYNNKLFAITLFAATIT